MNRCQECGCDMEAHVCEDQNQHIELREQIERYKKSIAITDKNVRTMQEELNSLRTQVAYYAGWEQRMHHLEVVASAAKTLLICDYQDAIYAHAELKDAIAKLDTP